MSQRWKVHKFGGTSVLNAERYKNVYHILTNLVPQSQKAIVVSAMKGTTDDLIKTVDLAQKNDETYKAVLQKIQDRHIQEVKSLLGGSGQAQLLAVFERDFKELHEILRGVWLVRTASDQIFELISGMGEVWSAQILNAYFQEQGVKTQWLDARQILQVDSSDRRLEKLVTINWQKSKENLANWQKQNNFDLVTITGFVARNEDGSATTLGRNGSDYSATIFGALFDCDEVFIWTDVDGALSADPRLVPEAVILNEMSYNEITELAYFGAKVVHPSTMAPAIDKEIPIWIKNTFNPTFAGTKIHKNAKSDRVVKGFSTIDQMCLLSVEGTGMVGIPGVAERLFGSLRSVGVSAVLISQASSEQTICFAISDGHRETARKAVENGFYAEIQKGLIQKIQTTSEVSILAAVGDNMAYSPGVAGKFFTALGQSGVNVRAIAQGSSERNISAVIDTKDAVKALRTVHSSFVLPHQTVSIGLIGPGLIGSTFIQQLKAQLGELKKTRKVDFKIRGIADSKKMYLAENEISLEQWKETFSAKAEPLNLKKFAAHIQSGYIPHGVIIESTASAALTPYYKEWLAQGLHIISPNKKANTGSMQEYQEIRAAAKKYNRHFLYSTNVGAGLPIVQTLRDLYATGDEIVTIQGILSGTLSFIFNQFDETQKFSQIVQLAKDKGYTEPDPREDLSGQDVMRKLVILAREIGMPIEPKDVKVESLVPQSLQSLSVDEFMKRLPELDISMQERIKSAQAKNEILRFVGTVNQDGSSQVRLENLPMAHAFSRTTGTDNIVLFKTKRYFNQPLVVQGPGAGPEVTAAGVFADLLRLSQYLGSIA